MRNLRPHPLNGQIFLLNSGGFIAAIVADQTTRGLSTYVQSLKFVTALTQQLNRHRRVHVCACKACNGRETCAILRDSKGTCCSAHILELTH